MITITRAPPYITVQNGGRKHSRSFGVPRGGAMDLFAIRAVNAIVGNSLDAAALEWALGGGTIRFDRDCLFAIGGATARATLSGTVVAPCTTTHARAGDEVTVEQITSGRFLYLACDGGIDVPVLLGSLSTYLPGHFGGYEGRMLRSGDSVALGARPAIHPAEGFHSAADLMPRYDSEIVHVTPGTQEDLFDESAWRTLTESEYRISTASDRTGYKLEGPALENSLGTLPNADPAPPAANTVTEALAGQAAAAVLASKQPTLVADPAGKDTSNSAPLRPRITPSVAVVGGSTTIAWCPPRSASMATSAWVTYRRSDAGSRRRS